MRTKPILTLTLLTAFIFFVGTMVYAAVEVKYFQVNGWEDNVVTLQWATASEQDISGFYVWRSETDVLISEIGEDPTQQGLVQLNPDNDPILNEEGGCDAASNEVYIYPDDTVAAEVDVYYYYLQAIKCLSTAREFYEEQPGAGGVQATRPTAATATPTATAGTGTGTATPTATTGTATATPTSTPSGVEIYLPIIMQTSASR